MIRRLILLATAVAALTALTIPASALAAEWQFEGEPLKEEAEVEVTGPMGYSAGTNGVHWQLHGVWRLAPGTQAQFIGVLITNCTGTGGLTGLTCDATVENLPWTVHCNANGSVTVTGIRLRAHYTPSGLAPSTTLTGNLVATGEGGSLDSVSLSGEGTVLDVGESQVSTSVGGTLEAVSPGYSCA